MELAWRRPRVEWSSFRGKSFSSRLPQSVFTQRISNNLTAHSLTLYQVPEVWITTVAWYVYSNRVESDSAIDAYKTRMLYYISCASFTATTDAIFSEMPFGRTTRGECARVRLRRRAKQGRCRLAGTAVVRSRRAKTFLPDVDDDDAAATTE